MVLSFEHEDFILDFNRDGVTDIVIKFFRCFFFFGFWDIVK